MKRWQLDETEREAACELLAELLRHPSPDPPGDERNIARFVADTLSGIGFEPTCDEFAPGRINVLTRLAGGGGPALVFSAHMDTMPIGDGAWHHAPFAAEIEDGKLYGRGAADMKSGLAAMIAAAGKIKRAGLALSGDLVLAFSAGESTGCIGAKRMIETGALSDAGWLVVSEPSSLGLLCAETGALWLDVVAHGVSGHASGGGGDNAIHKLLAFLDRLETHVLGGGAHPLLGRPSLAINGLGAGNAPNITPDRARATLDIRTLPGMQSAEVIAELAALGDSAGGGFTFEIIDDKPPIETPSDDPFVITAGGALERVTGRAATPGGVHYFSDSNVLVPALNIPRVIIGPGKLGMSGRADEWVALDAVYEAAAVYAEIAAEMLAA